MSNDKEPEINATATANWTVGPGDLASALPIEMGDAFPPVFATARMIGLMEIAASRVLQPLLGPGELSVGVTVDVSHTAPTPERRAGYGDGALRWAREKLFLFEVSVSDPAGEVGRGWHKRARLFQLNGCEAAQPNELGEVCYAQKEDGSDRSV